MSRFRSTLSFASALVVLVGVPCAADAAPSQAPLAPERATAKDKPAAPPVEASDVTHAVVVVTPSAGIGGRHFEFVDGITPGLRSYDLPAAPRMGVAGEVYPIAPFDDGILGGLGVSGAASTALGLDSARKDGNDLDTRWVTFDVALRMRVPVARGSAVYAKIGYGGVDFDFADPSALTASSASLPAVSYRFVRAGVDGRLAFWRVAALAGIDYLFVHSSGAIGERFPNASVGGLEANLGLAVPLARHFEARTGLVYQRFFFDLKPERGDRNVAGGALDELGRFELSLAVSN